MAQMLRIKCYIFKSKTFIIMQKENLFYNIFHSIKNYEAEMYKKKKLFHERNIL